MLVALAAVASALAAWAGVMVTVLMGATVRLCPCGLERRPGEKP